MTADHEADVDPPPAETVKRPAKPGITPPAEAALAARRMREAAALRENLRRRKQQAREAE